MPRPSSGPRLAVVKKRGWTRAVYYIRWTENGRSRERSTGTSGLEGAEEFFAEWLFEKGQARGSGPSRPAEMTIADVLTDYARKHGAETAAPERIGFAMDRLIDWWGNLTVDAIRQETCRRYWRDRGVSDGTVRRELGVLRAAINYAVKDGQLTAAPFVWLPPRPSGKERWLTRSEAAALLWAAKSEPKVRLYLPLFVLLGLYTGARKGAILSLRWTQVDLVHGRIDFNQPYRRQTNKRRPIIPIPKGLAWFLRKAHQRATCPYVIHRDGKPLRDVKKGFATACRRSGLEDVTPHTLRHTSGTWMAQKGVDLWQIGGYLGHTHARTTELYGHHHPDFLLDARDALG